MISYRQRKELIACAENAGVMFILTNDGWSWVWGRYGSNASFPNKLAATLDALSIMQPQGMPPCAKSV